MKLQRLAGFGPAAAFVSAASVVVFAAIQQVGAAVPPSYLVPVIVAFLASMAVFVLALAVTLFDLEWLDHPATSKPWIRLALVATLVAAAMPTVLGLIQFAAVPLDFAIPYTIYFLGIGVGLLVHGIEGRRAGIVRGPLAWLGIVLGALFIVQSVLQFLVLFTFALVMGAYYGLPIIYITYVVWAIWMGVHLLRSRSKSPAPVRAAAAAS